MNTTIDQIKQIRKIIKSQPELKSVRVRNGEGTAYGWVEISGNNPANGYLFSQAERKALNANFNLSSGSNFAIIAPEDRKRFIEKYGN